jgi:hypothetical protein
MDLFDAIGRRYSHGGQFTADPVPRGDLKTIVQAGIQAASAVGRIQLPVSRRGN